MHAAAGQLELADVRFVDSEPERTQLAVQLWCRSRGEDAVTTKRNDVAAERHRLAEAHRTDLDLASLEPADYLWGGSVETYRAQLFGQHAHHQVDVDVVLVDRRVQDLDPLVLHPASDLTSADLLAAQPGVADDHGSGLDHVEVPALEVAGADKVVDRDVVLEIETQHVGVLASSAGTGELRDAPAERRHEVGVTRVDRIGQFVGRIQEVDAHPRLAIRVNHLGVLAQRELSVKAIAPPESLAHERAVLRVLLSEPAKGVRATQQDIAQQAVFGIDAPPFRPPRAATPLARVQRWRLRCDLIHVLSFRFAPSVRRHRNPPIQARRGNRAEPLRSRLRYRLRRTSS